MLKQIFIIFLATSFICCSKKEGEQVLKSARYQLTIIQGENQSFEVGQKCSKDSTIKFKSDKRGIISYLPSPNYRIGKQVLTFKMDDMSYGKDSVLVNYTINENSDWIDCGCIDMKGLLYPNLKLTQQKSCITASHYQNNSNLTELFISENNGLSFEKIFSSKTEGVYWFYEANNKDFYFSNHLGFYKSIDRGKSWIQIAQIPYANLINDNFFYQDNKYSNDKGLSWKRLIIDNDSTSFKEILPLNDNEYVSAVYTPSTYQVPSKVKGYWYSSDIGKNWKKINSDLIFNFIKTDKDGNIYGVISNLLYKSKNKGDTFEVLMNEKNKIKNLEVNNNIVFYTLENNKKYYSINNSTFKEFSPPFFAPNSSVLFTSNGGVIIYKNYFENDFLKPFENSVALYKPKVFQ